MIDAVLELPEDRHCLAAAVHALFLAHPSWIRLAQRRRHNGETIQQTIEEAGRLLRLLPKHLKAIPPPVRIVNDVNGGNKEEVNGSNQKMFSIQLAAFQHHPTEEGLIDLFQSVDIARSKRVTETSSLAQHLPIDHQSQSNPSLTKMMVCRNRKSHRHDRNNKNSRSEPSVEPPVSRRKINPTTALLDGHLPLPVIPTPVLDPKNGSVLLLQGHQEGSVKAVAVVVGLPPTANAEECIGDRLERSDRFIVTRGLPVYFPRIAPGWRLLVIEMHWLILPRKHMYETSVRLMRYFSFVVWVTSACSASWVIRFTVFFVCVFSLSLSFSL